MSTVTVKYEDECIALNLGETFLEAALRNNIELPHSCCNGICQTCLVKITEGDIPEVSQFGLKENQKKQNLALACQLKPLSSLSIKPADNANVIEAVVVAHVLVSEDILILRIKAKVEWLPGQYATLWKDEKKGRPYSIASLDEEGFLEFHIKRHEKGEVSQWLHDHVSVGQHIKVSQPLGHCSYERGMKHRPLLLLGVGTGLAPLYGIAKEALKEKHEENIHLFVGEKTQKDHYLSDELFQIDQINHNFQYYPVVRDEEIQLIASKEKNLHGLKFLKENNNTGEIMSGDIVDIIKERYPNLQEWCVFICGSPMLVRKLQRLCFLNGASISNIYSDPFITK
ncbi:MAG: 2Fe-2S iron-sulfur cluster-binding protein [Cellvibrionaceae bacterium]